MNTKATLRVDLDQMTRWIPAYILEALTQDVRLNEGPFGSVTKRLFWRSLTTPRTLSPSSYKLQQNGNRTQTSTLAGLASSG